MKNLGKFFLKKPKSQILPNYEGETAYMYYENKVGKAHAQAAVPSDTQFPHWRCNQPILPYLGLNSKICHNFFSLLNFTLKFLPHRLYMFIHTPSKFQTKTFILAPSSKLPKTAKSQIGFPGPLGVKWNCILWYRIWRNNDY